MLFPILEAMDMENGEIVECAVIEETESYYLCKPLDEKHLDENAQISSPKAFEKAWWKIAKNDLSVQMTNKKYDASVINRYSYNAVKQFLQESLSKALAF